MRTGGLFLLWRFWLADTIRTAAVASAGALARLANAIDPAIPAPEWNPRLWDRDQDLGTEQQGRRP